MGELVAVRNVLFLVAEGGTWVFYLMSWVEGRLVLLGSGLALVRREHFRWQSGLVHLELHSGGLDVNRYHRERLQVWLVLQRSR